MMTYIWRSLPGAKAHEATAKVSTLQVFLIKEFYRCLLGAEYLDASVALTGHGVN